MNPLRLIVTFFIIAAGAFFLAIPKIYLKSTSHNLNLVSQSVIPVPEKNPTYQEPPQLSAKSAVVIDVRSSTVLFQKQPDIKLLPASTTKLMTAIVALENCSPETVAKVTFVESEPTQMGLSTGDSLTVESLLYGLLLNSGNDAAYALSYNCAPKTEEFIRQMNQKARQLGLKNTHFANPAGFDDPAQYTTSLDLAILAKVAVTNPLIAKIVSTKSTVVTDIAGTKTYYLENINKLLGKVDGLEGIKTGQTEGSLETLVTKTTRDDHTIITVILGSHDRFGESKQLIRWAFANYHWL